MTERLEKQLEFIKELDKIKSIVRQNYLCDASRRENDAEHSWHITMMAFLLKEYAPEGVDVQRVMQMALIHDVVEIDAGDTYAYDEKGNLDKTEREIKAADRIFNILEPDQAKYFRGLWDEFEECQTKEAIYCKALDVLQPVLLNNESNGKSWREHEVYADQILKRIAAVKRCSDELYEVVENILENGIKAGLIHPAR